VSAPKIINTPENGAPSKGADDAKRPKKGQNPSHSDRAAKNSPRRFKY